MSEGMPWEHASPHVERLLHRYADLLASDGARLGLVHLTRAQASDQIDRSLALAKYLAEQIGRSRAGIYTCIDVGSGSGLPAVPLAVSLQASFGDRAPHVFMVEPRRKSIAFLEKVARELRLAAEVVPERAQAAARGGWGSRGDFVTAKALADPRTALELCAPLCKIGGMIVLTGRTHGPGPTEALTKGDLRRLGLAEPKSLPLVGPGGVSQTIHVVSKVSKHEPAPKPAGGNRR